MSFAEDKWNKASCMESFLLVTKRESSTLKNTIQCLTQQLNNTRWMQAYPEKRIAKRKRNTKGSYTKGMIKAEEAEKKSIRFFKDHRVKIRNKIRELQEKPELDRQKCVAFAMGNQKRLGATSCIANFDPELVRMILEGV